MIPNVRHIHMVALIFASSADLCLCDSRAYKVKDSNEEFPDRDYTRGFTRSFTGEGSSGGFYGAGFHFPDFFNDGNQDAEGGSGFGLVSPFVSTFPSLSESRSSDSTYILPAHTFSTGSGFDESKSQIPVARSSLPGQYESRSSKKPIASLYDDWKPGDEHPRSNKWSQEHVDDDSSEVSGPKNSLTPYRGQNNYGRPYSETSLKQHYKPLRPVGKTHGTNYAPGEGETRVHQHKFGVSHIYDPKKKPNDETSYERYEDKLQDRKPQQFNSNPHHTYRNDRPPPGPGSYSHSAPRGRSSFKPSPPDYYRNSRTDRDFFSDSSKLVQKKLKHPTNHEHLDETCVKGNKTTTINMSDGQIFLNCYECYDKKHSRPYEQCVEVSEPNENKKKSQKRFRRDVSSSSVAKSSPVGREKRQYDDYYEGEGGPYGPDSSDYRFGPEHFNDDYPTTSYDDVDDDDIGNDYDSERCTKTRKGEMLCITCENRGSGGTYKQCSYASDPKKNSYERSVSKVYGSPRLPEENRRKQVSGPPKRLVASKRRPYSSPPSTGPSGSGDYSSEEPGYSRSPSGGRKVGSRGPPPRDYDAPSPKYRGASQGRAPLPARGAPRSGRTPASTHLRTAPRSSVRTSPRGSAGSNSPYQERYPPPRSPPPSSRAYSTPSPVGAHPYAYDLPDPYSPDPLTLAEGAVGGRHGARNRKNIDPSFDPGYDETFASLFPELVDGVDGVDPVDSVDPLSAVALAPPSYDEYDASPTDEYDEGPERRTDVRSQHPSRNTSRIHPTSESMIAHKRPPKSDFSGITRDKSACKKIRKNKMNCYQCVDEKGTKHEECMYVAGSEPKSKHMTYREVKELRYDPYNSPERESRPNMHNQETENHKPHDSSYRGKRKFKKYDPEEHNKSHSGSSYDSKMDNQRRSSDLSKDRYNVTVDQEGRRAPNGDRHTETRGKREDVEDPVEKTNSEIEKSTRKNYNPIPTDPPELDKIGEDHSENGEYSSDMELKYDPVLGLSLPKYMLEKSEHEAIFDEVLASGKR
ncbi:hypothetical protein GE061_016556 [Apolygus lucorum]|uniref:Uncharacterized protein n=1 Tax=Apolygus lucorum TaxID=248454 RepID=A0A6A4K5J2_APOLU|nr:hypothetical protein GE061_016556 [Apolygus lucorum]